MDGHPGVGGVPPCGEPQVVCAVTTVPKSKLGLPGQQPVDIVNLKCDPILIGSLRAEPGFYPAYHMNKENWITAALDGSTPEDKLRLVLDMSYTATAPKLRKK